MLDSFQQFVCFKIIHQNSSSSQCFTGRVLGSKAFRSRLTGLLPSHWCSLHIGLPMSTDHLRLQPGTEHIKR
jgi:hypothetical protein